MKKHADASLRFLATTEGGRINSLLRSSGGKCPQFHYKGEDWGAHYELQYDLICPGDSVPVAIEFTTPEAHRDRVSPGLKFELREGPWVIALGVIVRTYFKEGNKMKVTGHELKHLISTAKRRVETLYTKFDLNASYFPGEIKDSLHNITAQIEAAEEEVARLQSLLTTYNLQVKLEALGRTMTVLEATRLIGCLGRLEKKWLERVKDTSLEGDGGRFSTGTARDKDKVYKQHTMMFEDRVAQHERAEERARSLRLALAKANAVEIDLPLEP